MQNGEADFVNRQSFLVGADFFITSIWGMECQYQQIVRGPTLRDPREIKNFSIAERWSITGPLFKFNPCKMNLSCVPWSHIDTPATCPLSYNKLGHSVSEGRNLEWRPKNSQHSIERTDYQHNISCSRTFVYVSWGDGIPQLALPHIQLHTALLYPGFIHHWGGGGGMPSGWSGDIVLRCIQGPT